MAGISCFENVPEHHDPVEPLLRPELHAGDLLDGGGLHRQNGDRSAWPPFTRPGPGTGKSNRQPSRCRTAFEADPVLFPLSTRKEIGRRLSHPYILKFVRWKKKPALHRDRILARCTCPPARSIADVPEKDALKIAGLVCEALSIPARSGVIPDSKRGTS